MQKVQFDQLISGLVSIVTPVYNAEKYLACTLDSVLAQTYSNFEVILVDDASPDNSKSICDQYALNDSRITVISQKNGGPASARNTGVRHSRGEFILFLDGDDLIEKNTLELMIKTYQSEKPDLVMSNFSKLINDREKVVQPVTFSLGDKPFTEGFKLLSQKEAGDFIRHFLKHPSNHLVSYCWARMYKASIIKENSIEANERMHLFEDYVFYLEYLRHVNYIAFINVPLYVYRMDTQHISASMAIINADSLLYDMGVFKNKTESFFDQPQINNLGRVNIDREIGHALIHYVIIFFIRSCRQITKKTHQKIYDEIKKMVNSPLLQENLEHYSPSKGNSRILPWLMKFKLIVVIMRLCKSKANRRYGKLRES